MAVTDRPAGRSADADRDTVEDEFLDGRLVIRQPRLGYRAATDPVLLAAAVPAMRGTQVLDLGCGVGTAALCLGARVNGVGLTGLEVQQPYAELASANAVRNKIAMDVHQGDIRAMPAALRQLDFDVVMINPPWFEAQAPSSPIQPRDIANRASDTDMIIWTAAAMARVKPGGWMVMIQRAEALPQILGAIGPRGGDVSVLPLAARAGRAAKRVLVKTRKGSKGPFRLAAPLVLHKGETHTQDGDDFSDGAVAILRHGAGIEF